MNIGAHFFFNNNIRKGINRVTEFFGNEIDDFFEIF